MSVPKGSGLWKGLGGTVRHTLLDRVRSFYLTLEPFFFSWYDKHGFYVGNIPRDNG